jgi:hypothetical protein
MIRNINSQSPLVYVSVGGSGPPYVNMNAPSSGNLRYNANSSSFEVYDGSSNIWMPIYGNDVSINIDPSIADVVRWAKEKIVKEKEWDELAKSNTSVKIALDQYNEALTRLHITATLSKDSDETTS